MVTPIAFDSLAIELCCIFVTGFSSCFVFEIMFTGYLFDDCRIEINFVMVKYFGERTCGVFQQVFVVDD